MSHDSAIGTFTPLRERTFRYIWIGTTFTHAGGLIQGVGAAWLMSSMAGADMVALVQTATFLPMALLALPAGAVADVYDRRNVQLVCFAFSMLAAVLLSTAAWFGLLTPWLLLGFCFLTGTGAALAAPARGASVAEQVPTPMIPQAVALNNISYNVARSIGPALGGLMVAIYGATSAFMLNAIGYLPVLASLRSWKRMPEESRLPPEGLMRSINAGLNYIANMQPVRRAVIRAFVTSSLIAVVHSLLPLIARDLLKLDATAYGAMLGVYGVGAVCGIFVLQRMRAAFGSERSLRINCLVIASCLVVMAFSRLLWLDLLALFLAGCATMVCTTTISITVQLFVPRWVMGRAIATSSASMSLGIAGGSWLWGSVATQYGLVNALLCGAALLVGSVALGWIIPVADRTHSAETDTRDLGDPDVQLGINGRSGPISIELRYRIPSDRARDFYNIMREVQKTRRRTGAYDWSITRNIGDPELWSERFRCPTWDDYLRLRSRRTLEDANIFQRARDMHIGLEPVQVLRWLDRPFGSVRWRDDTPDRGDDTLRLES